MIEMDETLPPRTDPAATVATLAAQARVRHTPCGDGHMVWHEWGEGRPLVLFHGGHGSWTHWIRNIPALAARYRVIAADLPGLGDSALPPAPPEPDVVAEIVAHGLATLLGDGETVDVVGFSFGGMVGGHVAVKLGPRARSLTLVCSGGLGIPPQSTLDLHNWRFTQDPQKRLAAHRHNLATLMFADPATIDDLALHLQAENTLRARLNSRRLSQLGSLPGVLSGLRCPLGGIWGEQDFSARGRLEVFAARLEAMQAGATFAVIPGAGHWVQYEAPDAFNALLPERLDAASTGWRSNA
jgi:2-hydroxy-6-oxonona-2,4-dienedioate hydrolase